MVAPLYHYVSPIIYRGKVSPNILARLQLPEAALENRLLFHPYTIEDGDRPDTIAHLYYGNDLYDWVILLANKIVNIRESWPLTAEQFEAAILAKYGSYSNASETAYYEINSSLSPIDAGAWSALPEYLKKYYTRVSESTYGVTKNNFRINSNSLAALEEGESVYWIAVTHQENEFRLNEAKRHIRLIDSQYLPQLEQSLRILSRNVIV